MSIEQHWVEELESKRSSSVQLVVRERHAPESQLPLPGGAMSLSEQVGRNGPFDEAQAVGWVMRLARAVEQMHEAGDVHGSISAESVMTGGRDPRCWAVLRRHAPSPYGYRCPERLAGGGRSAADDTWALAVTLFYLLTSRLPFPGSDADEVRAVIEKEGVPPIGLCDSSLRRLIESALQQRISQRLLLAWCFRVALEGCIETTAGLPALQRHPWPPPTDGIHLPTSPKSTRPPVSSSSQLSAMLDEAKTIDCEAVEAPLDPLTRVAPQGRRLSKRARASEALEQLRRADRVREGTRSSRGKARRERSDKVRRADRNVAPSKSVRAIAKAIEQTLSRPAQ